MLNAPIMTVNRSSIIVFDRNVHNFVIVYRTGAIERVSLVWVNQKSANGCFKTNGCGYTRI